MPAWSGLGVGRYPNNIMNQTARWISDPISQTGHLSAKVNGELPLLCDKWLCKVQNRSINEIAAYQVAAKFGLPVPDHRFFVLSEPRLCVNTQFDKGDVGLLIEYIDHDRHTALDVLVREKPQASVTILAFLLFDRFEHCEVLWKDSDHWIIDLERHFPDFTGVKDAAHLLNLDWYLEQSDEAFNCCLNLAGEAGTVDSFILESKRLLTEIDNFEFDFTGYARADEASEHFSIGISQRTGRLFEFIKAFEAC